MSQSTRIFGQYLVSFTLGTTGYVAVCENADLDAEMGTQMATALNDTWEYPIGIRGKWSVSGKFFISTANTAGEGGPGGTLWTKFLSNSQQSFTMKDNSITGSANTFTGNGLITKCRQSIPDGPQTVDITLSGQGALSSSIA